MKNLRKIGRNFLLPFLVFNLAFFAGSFSPWSEYEDMGQAPGVLMAAEHSGRGNGRGGHVTHGSDNDHTDSSHVSGSHDSSDESHEDSGSSSSATKGKGRRHSMSVSASGSTKGRGAGSRAIIEKIFESE